MARKSTIERELQEFLIRGGQSKYKRIASALSGIPEVYNKAKMYTGNKLDDTYDALVNLLKVADSEAGMEIYERKLNEFTSDARKFGGYDDNIVQAETLKMLGNQKSNMRREFSTAIQDSSDFINTTQFLDKADEFVNIQDTIDRVNKELKADGKTEHESVADFLQSELANANSLRDNMVAGFQIGNEGEIVGTNFRYNKAETNDKEAFRKLNLYRDRLELATYSLAGDNKISSSEAEAIIIGNEKQYFAAKSSALEKAAYNYKSNKSMVINIDGLINTANQKALSAEDIFNMEGLDDAGKLEMANNLTAGSWDKVVQQLVNEKAEYKRLRNEANENYKNWYGSYFEEIEGGLTEEETAAYKLKLEQEKLETEKEKIETEKEKKVQEVAKKSQVWDEEEGIVGKYQEYSPPRSSRDAKEIADSLGEKSYSDVKKKYLSANPSKSFPEAWRASSVKREDTDKQLKNILNTNDMDESYIAEYIAGNNIDEGDFQKFLDNIGYDKNARDILYRFASSTYKLQEGFVSTVMGQLPGSRAVDIGGGKYRIVGSRKKGNKKSIKDSIANYKTVEDSEILALLYQYIGTKVKK